MDRNPFQAPSFNPFANPYNQASFDRNAWNAQNNRQNIFGTSNGNTNPFNQNKLNKFSYNQDRFNTSFSQNNFNNFPNNNNNHNNNNNNYNSNPFNNFNESNNIQSQFFNNYMAQTNNFNSNQNLPGTSFYNFEKTPVVSECQRIQLINLPIDEPRFNKPIEIIRNEDYQMLKSGLINIPRNNFNLGVFPNHANNLSNPTLGGNQSFNNFFNQNNRNLDNNSSINYNLPINSIFQRPNTNYLNPFSLNNTQEPIQQNNPRFQEQNGLNFSFGATRPRNPLSSNIFGLSTQNNQINPIRNTYEHFTVNTYTNPLGIANQNQPQANLIKESSIQDFLSRNTISLPKSPITSLLSNVDKNEAHPQNELNSIINRSYSTEKFDLKAVEEKLFNINSKKEKISPFINEVSIVKNNNIFHPPRENFITNYSSNTFNYNTQNSILSTKKGNNRSKNPSFEKPTYLIKRSSTPHKQDLSEQISFPILLSKQKQANYKGFEKSKIDSSFSTSNSNEYKTNRNKNFSIQSNHTNLSPIKKSIPQNFTIQTVASTKMSITKEANNVNSEPIYTRFKLYDYPHETQNQNGNFSEEKKINNLENKEEVRNYNLPYGYYSSPNINQINQMNQEELASIKNFCIWNNFGKIEWKEPVDLIGQDLERIVVIMEGEIHIYEDIDIKPKIGEKLNKPVRCTLFNFPEFDTTDTHSFEHIKIELESACKENGTRYGGIFLTEKGTEFVFEIDYF